MERWSREGGEEEEEGIGEGDGRGEEWREGVMCGDEGITCGGKEVENEEKWVCGVEWGDMQQMSVEGPERILVEVVNGRERERGWRRYQTIR